MKKVQIVLVTLVCCLFLVSVPSYAQDEDAKIAAKIAAKRAKKGDVSKGTKQLTFITSHFLDQETKVMEQDTSLFDFDFINNYRLAKIQKESANILMINGNGVGSISIDGIPEIKFLAIASNKSQSYNISLPNLKTLMFVGYLNTKYKKLYDEKYSLKNTFLKSIKLECPVLDRMVFINNFGISKLPSDFAVSFPNLKHLHFENDLSAETIFGIKTKKVKDSEFLHSLLSIPKIEGGLTTLSDKLLTLKKLETLTLINLKLKEIPIDIMDKFPALKSLTFENVSYTRGAGDDVLFPKKTKYVFPDAIYESKNIKKLNVAYTKFKNLDVQKISKMNNLRELNLSGQEIVSLPSDFLSLDNLKRLVLRDNKIKRLPNNYEVWNSLEYLDISGNPLDSINLLEFRAKLPLTTLVITDDNLGNQFVSQALTKDNVTDFTKLYNAYMQNKNLLDCYRLGSFLEKQLMPNLAIIPYNDIIINQNATQEQIISAKMNIADIYSGESDAGKVFTSTKRLKRYKDFEEYAKNSKDNIAIRYYEDIFEAAKDNTKLTQYKQKTSARLYKYYDNTSTMLQEFMDYLVKEIARLRNEAKELAAASGRGFNAITPNSGIVGGVAALLGAGSVAAAGVKNDKANNLEKSLIKIKEEFLNVKEKANYYMQK